MDGINPGVVAVMGAVALAGTSDYRYVYQRSERPFTGASRGPSGRSMQVVGKTEAGEDILQDRGGRQYVKSEKGTIRRLKN